ncbi:hypothetical protein WBG78_08475 [Chryseolinea sp. T2]|uniref:hypothetical protein n=1 Tax=Chryseolinea sp. T2 TaxID=3129255 RepID=UPI0030788D20
MKTVKTALGVKRIEERDQHLALLQLRELLDAHRNALITRLLADLPTYLDYKFGRRVNQKQLDVLKDKLSSIKNSSVDMDKYDFLYQHMLTNETTYVPSEPFYKEIDESISWYLNEAQLQLVK